MITFKGSKIAILKIQEGVYTQVFVDAMATQLRAAAAAWVKAILLKVPVYTGAAKGTFVPLTRVLSRFGVSNPYVGPVNEAAAHKITTGTVLDGVHYSLGYHGAQQYGQSFFDLPKATNFATSLTFTFAFSNNLPYMLWNDIYPAPAWLHLPSNPPWQYLNAGLDAFRNYVAVELPKYIPGIAPYITVQVVSVR